MESELSITHDDLLQEVAAFLGYGSDSSAWTVGQLAEVDRYVQSGIRRFYYPSAVPGAESGYAWSFLSPVATLSTAADDAAQDLPPQLGRVLGGFHYATADHRRSVPQVSEAKLQTLLSRSTSTGHPQVARVRSKPKEDGTGSRLEVVWWPIPDAVYALTYQYEAFTGKLNAANKYPLGGMRHSELIVQSCLSVAEQRANDERGLHTDDFERLLVAAIEQDRRQGAQHYGDMGEPLDGGAIPRHGDTGSTYPVTYKGSSV